VITIESTTTIIQEPETPFELDDAQLAALPFLARHSARTWRLTATACVATPSGPLTAAWRCCGRADGVHDGRS